MASKYTLSILLKKGSIKGGGLPNQSYVEILLDSNVVHKSKPAPPPHNFNDTHVLNLESVSNHVLGFTIYKKRWTSSGYKIIGDIVMPLKDLLSELDKGEVEKDMPIVADRKNMTLAGSLQFDLKFEEIQSADSPIEELPKLIIPSVTSFADSVIGSFTEFSNPSRTKIALWGSRVILLLFWLLNILAWLKVENRMDSFNHAAKSLEAKFAEAEASSC